jgi:hypothetical protein
MKRAAVLLVLVIAPLSVPVNGVVGCLTPAPMLASRADVVLVGRLESMSSLNLSPCPAESGGPPTGYRRCGSLPVYRVAVLDVLRGDVSGTLSVRVPLPSVLSLSCDDRPAPDKLSGAYAVLFLERADGALWSVDGPDGVYSSPTRPKRKTIDDMRALVLQNPRISEAGIGKP